MPDLAETLAERRRTRMVGEHLDMTYKRLMMEYNALLKMQGQRETATAAMARTRERTGTQREIAGAREAGLATRHATTAETQRRGQDIRAQTAADSREQRDRAEQGRNERFQATFTQRERQLSLAAQRYAGDKKRQVIIDRANLLQKQTLALFREAAPLHARMKPYGFEGEPRAEDQRARSYAQARLTEIKGKYDKARKELEGLLDKLGEEAPTTQPTGEEDYTDPMFTDPDWKPEGATTQPSGKELTREDAAAILKEAGGDKEKARQLARERGYTF